MDMIIHTGMMTDILCKLETDEICRKLVEISSRKELIEISFEILGLMMGDACYDQEEKNFMEKVIMEFNIDSEILEEMEKCLRDYLCVYKRIEQITNA